MCWDRVIDGEFPAVVRQRQPIRPEPLSVGEVDQAARLSDPPILVTAASVIER